MSQSLEEVYYKFAAFGKGATGASQGMDGKAFAKLCKDVKLISPKFTATDVDLIFANTKVKPKNERKITYSQFLVAVQLIAEKKGVSQEEIISKIVSASGPATNNTQKADDSGIYSKLTDASLYTGAHKARFNADGTGKGMEGRDRVAKGSGTVSSTPSTITKTSVATGSTSVGKKADTAPRAGSIFDRLTDTSKYTGAHKHRFDESGRGRGLAGRDVGGNGAGTHGGRAGDLSSITRTNLN